MQKNEVATLEEKSEELKRTTRLLGERNLQIRTVERDLAIKEETIQKLRLQLEEMQLEAEQVMDIVYPMQQSIATTVQVLK